MAVALSTFAPWVGFAPAAVAQHPSETGRLAACIGLIESDPEGAYEDGLAWMSEGSRPAARHCVALALVALGHEAEGAARLEQLANAPDGGTLEARIVYLTQSGNAWLMAGAPEASIVTLSNAIKLSPQDGQLRKDRARAHLVLKQWKEAGSDLDAAIELSPGDADALRMRAQALMEAGRLKDAWADIAAAQSQAPRDVSILVLRGRIRDAIQANGDPDPAG